MPPKAKLHKEKGKLKSIPKATTKTPRNNEPEPSTSNADVQAQFEVELVWCVQQLQASISSGKLSEKQMQDTTKTLNSLTSNSTPVIKKRQLMRLSFGDYRSKMAAEEKKYAKVNSKIIWKPINPSEKSVFIKKAPFLISDKNFKFNFNIDEKASEEFSKLTLEEQTSVTENNSGSETKPNLEDKNIENKTNVKEFHYQPSSNTFRFNFNSE